MARDTGFTSSEVAKKQKARTEQYNGLRDDVLSLRQGVFTAGETIDGDTSGPLAVYQSQSDGEIYLANASNTDKLKFIGFAVTDGTDGNSIRVQFHGIVSGFSGLTLGEQYYLQDTDGQIGSTKGTNMVLCGVAISSSQLLIQKGRRYATGTGIQSGITTINIGFRPALVTVFAAVDGTVSINSDTGDLLGSFEQHSYGVWNETDGQYAIRYTSDTDNNNDFAKARISNGIISAHPSITLKNVTETSFDLDASAGGEIVWTAVGDL